MKKLILIIVLFASITFGQNKLLLWGDLEGNLRDLANQYFVLSGGEVLNVLGGKYTLIQTGAQVQNKLNYSDFTSSGQTQMNLKANLESPTFTGLVNVTNLDAVNSISVGAGDTLLIGAGNSGFYDQSNNITVVIGGTRIAQFTAAFAGLMGVAANAYVLINQTATSTVATICPSRGDINTGIGWVSADSLALIAGGVNVMNIGKTGIRAVKGFVAGAPTGGNKGDGTINAVGVYDDNVLLTGADYVFEESYEQSSIKEMEAFYKKNKYLPTVGTWANDESKRPSVGDLAFRLLETVEVQAKYISELEARLTALEK